MSGESLEDICKRLEHFETPEWAAKAILRKEILTPWVFDPCVGTGVLTLAALAAGYTTVNGDIHDWGFPIRVHKDFLAYEQQDVRWWSRGRPFTFFFNPPFSKATEFVEHALRLGAHKVVCFQRYAWYESEERNAFWDKNPPNRIYICGSRATCWRHDIPKDKRKSSTRTAHAWFVWEKGHPPGTLTGRIYKADAA